MEEKSDECLFLGYRQLSCYTEENVFFGASITREGAAKLLDLYRTLLGTYRFEPHVDQNYMTVDLREDLQVVEVPFLRFEPTIPHVPSLEALVLCERFDGMGQTVVNPVLAFAAFSDLVEYLKHAAHDDNSTEQFRQRHGIKDTWPSRLHVCVVPRERIWPFRTVVDLPSNVDALLRSFHEQEHRGSPRERLACLGKSEKSIE